MDTDSSTKFIGSLTKFLQSLCNGYVEFQKGVELVGHIYLSIDTGEKVDYILHEKVSKNDENSVSFVSNSFHAQPLDKDKDKGHNKTATPSKSGMSGKGSVDSSDEDDIMIVDQGRDSLGLGSTNTGTIAPRGVRHGVDQRQAKGSFHNQGSSHPLSSPSRNRQHPGGPAATMTSQDNINMGEMKLEQVTSDELLSITSQVGDGGPSSRMPHMQSQHGGPARIGRSLVSDTAGQPVWIKQEPTDDAHGGPDTGWSPSDSSNSGSNLYPVMMHPNPAAYSSGPVFPGFPPTSGSSSHHGPGHSLPGTSGSANLYTGSLPGMSQNLGSMDPADDRRTARRGRGHGRGQKREGHRSDYNRRYWQRVKDNPEWYALKLQAKRERAREQYARNKEFYRQRSREHYHKKRGANKTLEEGEGELGEEPTLHDNREGN